MKRLSALLASLALLPALSFGAQPPLLSTLEDGSILARNAAGVALWRDLGSRIGTAASPQTNAAPFSVTMPTWDPLTTLSTVSASVAGPVFDSLGNAWVVFAEGGNLVAYRSNGVSGTWQPAHILGPVETSATASVGLAVDKEGGFYVSYGPVTNFNSTSNPLMLAKYSPSAGWQAAAQIYNSPMLFTETFLSIDSSGRLVVVFNPYEKGSNGISSIASDPTKTSWAAVQTIVPVKNSAVLPSVAANSGGTRLALVYLAYTYGQHGMRYSFFNSATGKWDSPQPVPNSDSATFSSYGTYNAYPIAVDETGNVTFIVAEQYTVRNNSPADVRRTNLYTVDGFRYEGGVWSKQQLIGPSQSLPSLDSFSGTAINGSGVVLIVTPLADGLNTGVNVTVFRYTPGSGWKTEVAVHDNSTLTNRCRIAWFEGTEAVAVYTDHSSTGAPLRDALYSNGVWGSGPPIPGNPTAVSIPALAAAPTGEALLVIPQEPPVYTTFLRP